MSTGCIVCTLLGILPIFRKLSLRVEKNGQKPNNYTYYTPDHTHRLKMYKNVRMLHISILLPCYHAYKE